ncbi:hypothetical protein JR316_0010457 [Psilocybe cubensis]|uniref:Uncharacterized protein n=3 Tax=Psilocybe cubensis TaxID=181762 RepID=A0ACB8GLB4_PSICU|nr:hypothetical protein JR316_0010457 [Psilocybe cubensis]KAH9476545.1 hypothetical protein JR316_0010457 [Psilocybe cubensis]
MPTKPKLTPLCHNPACMRIGSNADGEPLLKCSGCKNVFYCNRECQASAWKDHKKHCGPRPNAMSKKEEKAQLKESQSLLEFYKLHKDTIASCTLGAFCITLDRPTTRNLREMLVIQVVPNPASTRPETAFRVTDAKIMSLDSPETIEHFGQSQCEHFRKYLVEVAKMNERVGNIGGFMVVLETNSIKYYEPVSFKRPPVLLPSSNPDDIPLRLTWRQSLIRTLNSGRIDF